MASRHRRHNAITPDGRTLEMEPRYWLIGLAVLAVLVLAVVALRGRIRIKGTHRKLRFDLRASRDKKPSLGTAIIDRSESTGGGARAEGTAAEIRRTKVAGNLIARADHPGGKSDPKSSSTDPQSRATS